MMAKANVSTVPRGEAPANDRKAAELFASRATVNVARDTNRTSAVRDPDEHLIHDRDGKVSETVAIRHHLDTLILKLAAAQAGSLAAVRDSRIHAAAALAILSGSEEVVCEHARVSGVDQTAREWICEGCGAHWPKSTPADADAPTHRKVHDAAHPAAGRH